MFRFEQSIRRRRGHVRRRWSATGWSVGFGTVAPVATLTNLRGLSYIVQRRGGAELAGVRTTSCVPCAVAMLLRCAVMALVCAAGTRKSDRDPHCASFHRPAS